MAVAAFKSRTPAAVPLPSRMELVSTRVTFRALKEKAPPRLVPALSSVMFPVEVTSMSVVPVTAIVEPMT